MSKYDGFQAWHCGGALGWYLSDGISLYLRKDGEIYHSTPHWYPSEAGAMEALEGFKVIEAENAAIDLYLNVYTIRYQGMICVLHATPVCGFAFISTTEQLGTAMIYYYMADTAEQCLDQAKAAGYKVSVLPVSSDWGND